MNTIVSRTDYLPFGVRMTGNGLSESTTARSVWFGFSGKENELWDAESSTSHWLRGERYQHFGARYYDPVACSWTGVDPLAESYFNISPFAYCAGDLVNNLDSEGEKIIFVNGYLIKGKNRGGQLYWNDSFVQGAQSFFKDNSVYYTNINYRVGSSASRRRKLGYYFAKENYASLIEGVNENDSFELVSHSMGGAFSIGIKEYLEEQGWLVKSSIFINTYQSDKITLPKEDPSFTVDYQNTNDPVLFWFDINLGKGRIKNADIMIREKSEFDLDYIHKGPMNSGKSFWDNLEMIINRSSNANE